MGSSYGRKTGLGTTGNLIQVNADGRTDWYKMHGVTIDWTTVTAVAGADATLADGTVVKIGDKYIRYGKVLAKITASGKYGPAATGAADGRQTLTRGSCFILDRTVVESHLGSDHPPVLEGGPVFADRIASNENVAGETNPTDASILAAFPSLRYVRE